MTEIPEHLQKIWKAAHLSVDPATIRRMVVIIAIAFAVGIGVTFAIIFADIQMDPVIGQALTVIAVSGMLIYVSLQMRKAYELIRLLTDPPVESS